MRKTKALLLLANVHLELSQEGFTGSFPRYPILFSIKKFLLVISML